MLKINSLLSQRFRTVINSVNQNKMLAQRPSISSQKKSKSSTLNSTNFINHRQMMTVRTIPTKHEGDGSQQKLDNAPHYSVQGEYNVDPPDKKSSKLNLI